MNPEHHPSAPGFPRISTPQTSARRKPVSLIPTCPSKNPSHGSYPSGSTTRTQSHDGSNPPRNSTTKSDTTSVILSRKRNPPHRSTTGWKNQIVPSLWFYSLINSLATSSAAHRNHTALTRKRSESPHTHSPEDSIDMSRFFASNSSISPSCTTRRCKARLRAKRCTRVVRIGAEGMMSRSERALRMQGNGDNRIWMSF